jgi:putative endonuclease
MSKHLALGKAGESAAADWLQQKGYTIVERNFRWGKTEIDIVALKGEWLHIIEVKTNSSNKWGSPEQRVTPQKMSILQRAATGLLRTYGRQWLQYDVVSITWEKGDLPFIELIEDLGCS